MQEEAKCATSAQSIPAMIKTEQLPELWDVNVSECEVLSESGARAPDSYSGFFSERLDVSTLDISADAALDRDLARRVRGGVRR